MNACNILGVGLAVVEDGEIVYVRGYGVRDVTTGAPVTPATQFAIGSTTKSFTALGMMVLVEEGRVNIDASVRPTRPSSNWPTPKLPARRRSGTCSATAPAWCGPTPRPSTLTSRLPTSSGLRPPPRSSVNPARCLCTATSTPSSRGRSSSGSPAGRGKPSPVSASSSP